MSCTYCSIDPARFNYTKALEEVKNSESGYGVFIVDNKELFVTKLGACVEFEINYCPSCGENLQERHEKMRKKRFAKADKAFKQAADASKDDSKPTHDVTVFTENMFVNPEAVKMNDYKNGWVIINADTGEVIDDGNGYGFKSRANAIKHYQYVYNN